MPLELDFVTDELVERVYQRAQRSQESHRSRRTPLLEAYRDRGVRLARRRDARLLKFLDLASERMWKLQQPQVSRFRQEGFDHHAAVSGEFTEFSTFKQALLLSDEGRDSDCSPEVFGWLYAAVAEAIYGPL